MQNLFGMAHEIKKVEHKKNLVMKSSFAVVFGTISDFSNQETWIYFNIYLLFSCYVILIVSLLLLMIMHA